MKRNVSPWAMGLVVVFVGLCAGPAHAQVWVGPEHELQLELGSAFQFSNRSFEGPQTLAGVGVQSLRNTLGVSFVPIERLSIEASGTWQADKYGGAAFTGSGVDVRHGENDFGDWNGNIGDFEASARYVVYDGAVTVTPDVHTKLPLGDYPSTGWAATGTGLKEIGAGLNVGKVGVFTERLLLWGGYSFTYVEKEDRGGADTLQYRPSYSQGSVAAAYVINDRMVAGGGADYRYTHDGFELKDWGPLRTSDPTNGLVLYHDPVTRREYLALNAFFLFALTEKLDLAALFSIIPVGDNVTDAKTIGLQLSWTVMSGT